jgi:hypothetical protein
MPDSETCRVFKECDSATVGSLESILPGLAVLALGVLEFYKWWA